jgi:hypothetical protein
MIKLENIGNCARIRKIKYSKDDKRPYKVEFALMYSDGTCDKADWGIHDMGPGSVSSEFKTQKDARLFLDGVKRWKPKSENDDGLDYNQNLIRKIHAKEKGD